MGAAIANVSGRFLTAEVSDLLTQPELESMPNTAAAIFGAEGMRNFPIQYFGLA